MTPQSCDNVVMFRIFRTLVVNTVVTHYQTVNGERWSVTHGCATTRGVFLALFFVCGFRHVYVAAAGAFSNSAGSDYLDADK